MRLIAPCLYLRSTSLYQSVLSFVANWCIVMCLVWQFKSMLHQIKLDLLKLLFPLLHLLLVRFAYFGQLAKFRLSYFVIVNHH